MAEAPVPDRPNTQSNGSPWFKVPGHADVLTRTMRGGCATWAAAQSSALRLSELASQLRAGRSQSFRERFSARQLAWRCRAQGM
jgi:hypothetical protein